MIRCAGFSVVVWLLTAQSAMAEPPARELGPPPPEPSPEREDQAFTSTDFRFSGGISLGSPQGLDLGVMPYLHVGINGGFRTPVSESLCLGAHFGGLADASLTATNTFSTYSVFTGLSLGSCGGLSFELDGAAGMRAIQEQASSPPSSTDLVLGVVPSVVFPLVGRLHLRAFGQFWFPVAIPDYDSGVGPDFKGGLAIEFWFRGYDIDAGMN